MWEGGQEGGPERRRPQRRRPSKAERLRCPPGGGDEHRSLGSDRRPTAAPHALVADREEPTEPLIQPRRHFSAREHFDSRSNCLVGATCRSPRAWKRHHAAVLLGGPVLIWRPSGIVTVSCRSGVIESCQPSSCTGGDVSSRVARSSTGLNGRRVATRRCDASGSDRTVCDTRGCSTSDTTPATPGVGRGWRSASTVPDPSCRVRGGRTRRAPPRHECPRCRPIQQTRGRGPRPGTRSRRLDHSHRCRW